MRLRQDKWDTILTTLLMSAFCWIQLQVSAVTAACPLELW